jgi:hypothetical protein
MSRKCPVLLIQCDNQGPTVVDGLCSLSNGLILTCQNLKHRQGAKQAVSPGQGPPNQWPIFQCSLCMITAVVLLQAALAKIRVVAQPDQSDVAVLLLIISGAECGN